MRSSWLVVVALSVVSSAEAAKPPLLRVLVTDAAGNPVSDAVMVVQGEGERHRVHSQLGSWEGVATYPADGSERLFTKGEVVAVVAAAPGYGPTKAEKALAAKSNVLTVVLEPVAAPALPCMPEGMAIEPANGAAISTWAEGELAVRADKTTEEGWCLLAARSYGAWLAWQVASDARADGTMEAAQADASAQRRVYETSREWLEWSAANAADVAVAGALCQVATEALEPCL